MASKKQWKAWQY